MDCQFCKKEAEFEIEIEIVKMPEYLIFLLYNYQKDIEIKFLDEKLYKDYKFESFIVKKEKSKLDYLIKKLKCSNVNNKEYITRSNALIVSANGVVSANNYKTSAGYVITEANLTPINELIQQLQNKITALETIISSNSANWVLTSQA
jgi:hypothetical protein